MKFFVLFDFHYISFNFTVFHEKGEYGEHRQYACTNPSSNNSSLSYHPDKFQRNYLVTKDGKMSLLNDLFKGRTILSILALAQHGFTVEYMARRKDDFLGVVSNYNWNEIEN
ncbi:hypothetical protein [Bacteriovorax sp. Seq25_V]|uniref:hypothetical protein n=1 Tax=Bacteriovorax sp. Seq25_V TaxID=1201288 RepID=UPI0004118560|nr:hypothetical protein [Bacteriovorax sp. Seq25_V]